MAAGWQRTRARRPARGKKSRAKRLRRASPGMRAPPQCPPPCDPPRRTGTPTSPRPRLRSRSRSGRLPPASAEPVGPFPSRAGNLAPPFRPLPPERGCLRLRDPHRPRRSPADRGGGPDLTGRPVPRRSGPARAADNSSEGSARRRRGGGRARARQQLGRGEGGREEDEEEARA